MIQAIVFYSLAVLTVVSALCVTLLRNVLHSALALGACFLGVAGLYATLSADFLFASQIMVYVGGILIIILFAILLAGRVSELLMRQINEQWLAAGFVATFSFLGLLHYLRPFRSIFAAAPAAATTAELGRLLMGDWALPFEIISLILLASLTGVIVFSKTDTEKL